MSCRQLKVRRYRYSPCGVSLYQTLVICFRVHAHSVVDPLCATSHCPRPSPCITSVRVGVVARRACCGRWPCVRRTCKRALRPTSAWIMHAYVSTPFLWSSVVPIVFAFCGRHCASRKCPAIAVHDLGVTVDMHSESEANCV